jgi:hypothetical protein
VDSYPDPVNKLLTLGAVKSAQPWRNYRELGLGAEHVPELIRMATDPALNQADSTTDEVWAPLHAWRALGQLQASEALEPLLSLLDAGALKMDDWALEDLPETFVLLGPGVMGRLARYLADDRHQVYARLSVIQAIVGMSIVGMSNRFTDTRDEAVAILRQQLESAAGQAAELNAFLVGGLLDMAAVEAADTIELEEMVCGGWPEARYELGLGEKPAGRLEPDLEKHAYRVARELSVPAPRLERPPRHHKAKAKAKARRKIAAQSRKQNRAKKRR